jgi:hypothetical protein
LRSIVNVGHKGGSPTWVSARSFVFGDTPCGCQRGQGDTFTAFGTDWWDDWSTGVVYRQEYDTGPVHLIAVTANPPVAGGPCLTSMAAGGGSAWVTLGPAMAQPYAHEYTCRQ